MCWRPEYLLKGLVASVGTLVAMLFVAEPVLAQVPGEATLNGHFGTVYQGRFTPDGLRAITVSSDQTARCWSLKDRREVVRFLGHTGPVFSIAISGDGQSFVTGAQDNSLILWDVPPVNALWEIPSQSSNARCLVATPDGSLLLTAGDDKVVRIWNTAALSRIKPKMSVDPSTLHTKRDGHEHPILCGAVRSDGNLFATGDSSGRILLWSPFLNSIQGELGFHLGGVTELYFHPNNQLLLSRGRDGLTRTWQLPTAPSSRLDAVNQALRDLCVVPNQANAIVACNDQIARLIDLSTGKLVREYPRCETPISAIAVAPNGSMLAIAGEGGTIRVVNVGDGVLRAEIPAHNGSVRDLMFHPDSQMLYSAGSDTKVHAWQFLTSDSKPVAVKSWEGLPSGASALAITPDASKLAVGSGNGELWILKMPEGELLLKQALHADAVTEINWSADGQHLFSSSRDKSVKRWELAGSREIYTIPHPSAVSSVSLSSSGQRLVTTAEDGIVRVCDASNGLVLQSSTGHTPVAFGKARWSADQQSVLSFGGEPSLRVWKPAVNSATKEESDSPVGRFLINGGSQWLKYSGNQRMEIVDVNSGQVARSFDSMNREPRVIALRRDGQRLAVGDADGRVTLWNMGDGLLLQSWKVDGSVEAIAWSDDLLKLAVATSEKNLIFYGPPLPPATSQPGKELVEHSHAVTSAAVTHIAFDPDHKSVLAMQNDGKLALWKYANPSPIRRFNHGGPVNAVAISGDGRTIVSASADQTVRVWDSVSGQQRSQLNGHVGPVLAIAMSPDESVAVSSGSDRSLRLWDIVGGRLLKQIASFDEAIYAIAIHPNGQTVAAGGADRRVYLVNVLSGGIERVLEGHRDYIHSLSFNANGSKLLSYTYSGDLRCWDLGSGQSIFQQRVGRIGNSVSYSPDNQHALFSNGDDTARVIELPAPAR